MPTAMRKQWLPMMLCELSTDRVVMNLNVFLILGAGNSTFLAFNDCSVPGVLHIVFCLGRQQLSRRSIQVLLATVLKGHEHY